MKFLYLLIPACLIVFFLIPIFFKVKASYNVFLNKGAMGFFVFGKNVKSFVFKVGIKGIRLFEEIKESEIDFFDNESLFAEKFMGVILKKIKIKHLQINYNIGLCDAFQTSMFCGVVNTSILTFFTKFKSKKPKTSLLICDNIAFNQFVFECAFIMNFSLSFFSFVYSLIKTSILIAKKKNQ